MLKRIVVAAILGFFLMAGGVSLMRWTGTNSHTHTTAVANAAPGGDEVKPAEPEVEVHKPADLNEVREALGKVLHDLFIQGDYHIEVTWDKNGGGLVKLLIVPMEEWKAEQAAKEEDEQPGVPVDPDAPNMLKPGKMEKH